MTDSPRVLKLERQWRAAVAKTSEILSRPRDDPTWDDTEFWVRRWPSLVDREAEACDKFSATRLAMLRREELIA